jgi:hypothetical protein
MNQLWEVGTASMLAQFLVSLVATYVELGLERDINLVDWHFVAEWAILQPMQLSAVESRMQ